MFEAFSVGVRLRLIDSVSTGLIALAGQFGKLNSHVNATNAGLESIEKRMKNIKLQAFAGGALFTSGAVGLSMFDAPIKAAREYDLALNKFKNLNLGDAINTQADKFARGAHVMGVSATQLMETLSESVGIFGNYNEAAKLTPMIAGLNAANAAVYQGKVGTIDEGAARSLMKFIDRRGGTKDEESYKRNVDLAERLVTGSGGFIKFNDLASFSQQAGTAFRGLSDQGIMNYAAILQEQGGSRAGTALMSLYQNLIAGRTPKRTMEELQAFGFGAIGQAQAGTMGGKAITTTKFELFKPYADLMQSDPVAFYRDDFLPILAQHGITNQADIIRITNDLFSNRTASGQASLIDTQMFQVLRDANLTKNAKGYEAVMAEWKKDPNSSFADATARWNDLLVTLGNDTLPTVIKGVDNLNIALQKTADLMNSYPKTTTALAVGVGALAGLATLGGSILLVTSGFRALKTVLGVGEAGAGIGSQLGEVTTGLGGLASVLGRFALAGAVFTGAYALTRLIADAITPKDWTFGGWLHDKVYGEYDPNAPDMHGAPRSTASSRWGFLPAMQSPSVARGVVSSFESGFIANQTLATVAALTSDSKQAPSRFIAPKGSTTVNLSVPVMLENEKIGMATTKFQMGIFTAPQTGINGFNPMMQLAPMGGY